MTFLQRLFFWYPAKRIEVVKKSSNTLSLSEWCSEKTLVSTGGRLWANPDFQMAIDILENEHPAYRVLNPNCRPDQRSHLQAIGEGYTMALANLRALKVLNQKPESIEPTFEPEQEK